MFCQIKNLQRIDKWPNGNMSSLEAPGENQFSNGSIITTRVISVKGCFRSPNHKPQPTTDHHQIEPFDLGVRAKPPPKKEKQQKRGESQKWDACSFLRPCLKTNMSCVSEFGSTSPCHCDIRTYGRLKKTEASPKSQKA